MLIGFCKKKKKEINAGKVAFYCWRRWKCIHLQLEVKKGFYKIKKA